MGKAAMIRFNSWPKQRYCWHVY